MSRYKVYDSKFKAKVVLEYLKGRLPSEICNEYGIGNATLYQWKDLFLTNINRPFEVGARTKEEEKLKKQNAKLKQIIAEQALELKKNEEEFI
jgi:transposase